MGFRAFLGVFFATINSTLAAEIDYSQHGVNWTSDKECMLDRQSPVDISPGRVLASPAVSFRLVNYQDITTATVEATDDGSRLVINYPTKDGSKPPKDMPESDLSVTNELG